MFPAKFANHHGYLHPIYGIVVQAVELSKNTQIISGGITTNTSLPDNFLLDNELLHCIIFLYLILPLERNQTHTEGLGRSFSKDSQFSLEDSCSLRTQEKAVEDTKVAKNIITVIWKLELKVEEKYREAYWRTPGIAENYKSSSVSGSATWCSS